MWFADGEGDGKDPGPGSGISPFHSDINGTLYNSNATRDWTKLRYDFDILAPQGSEKRGDAAYIERITKWIDDNYGNTQQILMQVPKDDILADGAPALSHKEVYPDYLANIIYDR